MKKKVVKTLVLDLVLQEIKVADLKKGQIKRLGNKYREMINTIGSVEG